MPAVSELRQWESIQLGQVGSSSATARSHSTVIASSRPAALSGSNSTAELHQASQLRHISGGQSAAEGRRRFGGSGRRVSGR